MKLRASANTRISENSLGRTVSFGRKATWRHKWYTEPIWSPVRKRWECTVRAGFVNGRAPVVATTAGAMRGGAFYGQIIDAYSGAAEIAQAARLASTPYDDLPEDAVIDVPLYKRPPIGLHAWKPVTRIPQYFRDRGAVPPPTEGFNAATGRVHMAAPQQGARRLVSCDVILHQPRVALTSSITASGTGAVLGTSIVQQTLGMRPAAVGDRLRIQTGNFDKLVETGGNFGGATQLLDNYEEKNWDRLKISTVYLLSPPDAADDAPVDETWQAHVQHAEFWDLFWYQPLLRDAVLFNDIFAPVRGTLTVLGGGAGYLWASAVTASLNDAVQGAYNILKATTLAGTFWTATGGGSTSTWPEEETALPPEGLNKAANARAKAAASYAEMVQRRLDPPFPYEARPFNRALLS